MFSFFAMKEKLLSYNEKTMNEFNVNVCILGSQKSGKSSYLQAIAKEPFVHQYKPTTVTRTYMKKYNTNAGVVNFNLIDTAKADESKVILYANGCLLFVTSEKELNYYHKYVKDNTPVPCVAVYVNKGSDSDIPSWFRSSREFPKVVVSNLTRKNLDDPLLALISILLGKQVVNQSIDISTLMGNKPFAAPSVKSKDIGNVSSLFGSLSVKPQKQKEDDISSILNSLSVGTSPRKFQMKASTVRASPYGAKPSGSLGAKTNYDKVRRERARLSSPYEIPKERSSETMSEAQYRESLSEIEGEDIQYDVLRNRPAELGASLKYFENRIFADKVEKYLKDK